MKKILFLFLLILLCSCLPRHNFIVMNEGVRIVPIYLDEKWNDSERDAIKLAIQNWNYSLNNEMVLKVMDEHYKISSSPDPGYLIIKISEKDLIVEAEEQFISLAWTNGVGGNRIYLITDRLIPRRLFDNETPWDMQDITEITMHELGHAMGAEHIKYDGLMADHYNKERYKCIDAVAVFGVAKYHHLHIPALKYCVN